MLFGALGQTIADASVRAEIAGRAGAQPRRAPSDTDPERHLKAGRRWSMW
jgi:hypothetical protein